MPAQTIPSMIGKYKITSVIGKGGMGTVYLAMHPSLKRQVIIKKLQLKTGGGVIRERFKREAQIMMDLSSPHIVRMFDYFTEGRSDYIVLEFVDGMSLDKLLEKQTCLPPQLALVIFMDACSGLKYAHNKDIVHRDIKPGNIMMSRRAEIKLGDFGIAGSEKESDLDAPSPAASSAATIADTSITQAGTMLGTPAYMSPEQFDDSHSVDKRADIYSMGVMLYEMVTGTKPYAGDMKPQTILKIKKGSYIPPEKIDKSIPPIIRTLIKKMMKPNPDKRYQTMDPILSKIKKYLSQYDTHAIRVALANSMATKNLYEYPEFLPKNLKAKKTGRFILAAIIAGTLFFYGWTEGFFHATVLKKWYSPVLLHIVMPSTASADADLPARAFFFENDNNDIPEIKNSRRIFNTKTKDKTTKNITYSTKPVYLKPGEYRIKISEGPYVWWKSISVGHEKIDLNLDFLKNASRNLTIHFASQDNATGEDLTDKTVFKLQSGGKWVDVKKVNMKNLKTGTVHKILASADGYEDEYFSLRIDWYQDELFINGSLRKKTDEKK